MAIALVKANSGTNSASTAVAPGFGSATTAGNLIVLTFSADDYNGTPDAGWTQSSEMGQDDGTIFHGSYIWWRISAGETTFTATIGSATSSSWTIAEYSGCSATPYDASQGQYANSAGTTYTTDAVVPSSGSRLLVEHIGGWSNSNNLNGAYTSLVNSFNEAAHAGNTGVTFRTCALQAYRVVTGDGVTTFSGGATYPASCASRSALIASFKAAGGAFTLAASAGSFSYSGTAATPKKAHRITASAGSFAATGSSATLTKGGGVASIALVQSNHGVNSAATAVAPTFLVASTAGNLVVLTFSADDYNGSPDAGWTQSTNMEQQGFHGSYIWWRISAGETSFTVTVGSSVSSAWTLSEWSGVSSSPYDVSDGQHVDTSGTTYTTPAITPTTGSRLLIAQQGGASSSNNLNGAWASLLNTFTEVAHDGNVNPVSTRQTTLQSYRLVTGDGVTAFSTGATYPASVESRSGLLIAFKAAAASSNKSIAAISGSFAVTGTAATPKLAHKIAMGTNSFAVTGTAVTLTKGVAGTKSIVAGAGSWVMSGSAVTLTQIHRITAGAGSFVMTGDSVIVAVELIAVAGAFTYTGTNATLRRTWKPSAAAGSFTYSGTAATPKHGWRAIASSGSFGVTGADVALRSSGSGPKILAAGAGSFSYAGTSVTLTYSTGGPKTISASAGSFTVTGVNAFTARGIHNAAAAGSFTYSGSSATTRLGRKLVADNGNYSYSGTKVRLDSSAVIEIEAGVNRSAAIVGMGRMMNR